jgi:membrane-bound serine protease (ClpP class)
LAGWILCGGIAGAAGDGAGAFAGRIVVVPVGSAQVEDGGRLRSLRQLLQAASDGTASAIVLELETSAGYDPVLAGLLLEDLTKVKVPLHAYVRTSALGMGALAALGCDTVTMHPVAVIGGATPRLEGKLGDPASNQVLSVLKARARGLAEAKGHAAEWAAAFIDPGREPEAKDGDPNAGEVVTLTAREALERGLAKAIAPTVEDALRALGMSGEPLRVDVEAWVRDNLRGAVLPESGKAESAPPVPREEPPAAEPRSGGDGLFTRRDPVDYAGRILVVHVGWDDLVAKARFQFMERVLEKARKEKASALIVEMDTPGGYALETSKILKPFQDLPFPTYTFVNTHAESAGALIALATDHIYMYPTSTIGSALVITGLGEDLPGNLSKKVESMTRAEVRNIALAKGHNPDVAEAFVTTETELVIDGVMICKKGDVLNLNAVDATRVFDGKPLLAKGTARSVEEIVEREGLPGTILRVEPSPLEAFAQWVQLASAILIAIGLAGAYTEMQSPGFGLPGLVSVIAFGLFFFGNYAAGNMAGYETAVVFGIGVALLVLELLVIPGTFVAGTIGLVLMIGALGFSLVDRYQFEEFTVGGAEAPALPEVFTFPALTLSAALTLTMLLIGAVMRFLPSLKPLSWLVLRDAVPAGPSLPVPMVESGGGRSTMLHAGGVALTDLRPSGKARIVDRVEDVTTEGEYIERGTPITVVRLPGDRIVVAAKEPA